MIKYITKRPLWFNILVAIGIVVIIFLIFMMSLNWITRHGDSKTVPAVTGKNLNDVQELLSEGGFELVLQDSVYYDSIPPGTVIKQVPEADQVVKVNRTVYVIINRFVPPDIEMPNLVGLSFRNAQMTLQNLGLKVGDTVHQINYAQGSIMEMKFKGNTITPGQKIKVGSKIDLVVAAGLGDETIRVPNLIGMQFSEARALLDANGLVLFLVPPGPDVKDTSSAYVVWQSPNPAGPEGGAARIRPGQMVDVRISATPPVKDTTNNFPQLPE
jgi:eukaryotic-like serine/threonine-protein kinase